GVEAELVGQLDLLERLRVRALLGFPLPVRVRPPRPRHVDLVEQVELHTRRLPLGSLARVRLDKRAIGCANEPTGASRGRQPRPIRPRSLRAQRTGRAVRGGRPCWTVKPSHSKGRSPSSPARRRGSAKRRRSRSRTSAPTSRSVTATSTGWKRRPR